MGHQYAGANAFPVDFTIPDDLDDDKAVTFNVAFQALGDRTAYLNARCIPRADLLTAPAGNWTCPPGVTQAWLETIAPGGGGASGGGGDATTPATRCAFGGGGGAGGRKSRVFVTGLIPGTVYAYVNGAGGLGGPPGVGAGPAVVGSDGADSTFNGVIVARGAGGGFASAGPYTSAPPVYARGVPGGRSPRSVALPGSWLNLTSGDTQFLPAEAYGGGQGGASTSSIGMFAGDGGCSAEGFAGGALGAPGGTVTNRGGGGGGGGGAGAGGPGGAGGAGGIGSLGANQPGVVGTAGAPNTGAGGGGGGASGEGTATLAGAAGGAGGSGSILVMYFGAQAVFT